MKKNRGFTLIETIVYIALLAFMMTGALLATWEILQGQGKVNVNTSVQDETNFVMRKITWALTGVKTITTPSSGYSTSLSLTKYDGTKVDICVNTNTIKMRENGVLGLPCSDPSYAPLTSSNVSVTMLGFQRLAGPPVGLVASTTISGVTASTTKYIR